VIFLAEGATLQNLLNSIYDRTVYYDPCVILKLINKAWKPQKKQPAKNKMGKIRLVI
jgi:hypothetical protein